MEQQEYTFTLTIQELEVIGAALGELPMKLSKPVLDKVQEQFNKQQVELAAAKQQ